ncbi:MAG: hypothetical protein ACMUIL_10725 [bacterium]
MKGRILMLGIICFLGFVCISSHALAGSLEAESPMVVARAAASGYRYADTKEMEEQEDKDWYLLHEEGEEMEENQFVPPAVESEDEDMFRYLPLEGEPGDGRYQDPEEMDDENEGGHVTEPSPEE